MATKIKIVIAVGIVLTLSFIFTRFTFQQYRIQASSMEDTILIGDRIVVNQAAYGLVNPITKNPVKKGKLPVRGDVVLFKYPIDTSKLFFKRVVGMPGETLEIRNHTVMINGEILSEPYALFKEEFEGLTSRNMDPLKIPSNSYFLLGDNRNNSKDSRAYGPVDRNLIIGKAIYISFSYDASEKRIRWGRIGTFINNDGSQKMDGSKHAVKNENKSRVQVGQVPKDYKMELPSDSSERQDIDKAIRGEYIFYSDVINSLKNSKQSISKLKGILNSNQEDIEIQIRAATALYAVNEKSGRQFLFQKLGTGSEDIQEQILDELIEVNHFSYPYQVPALNTVESKLILHISKHANLDIRLKALEAAVTYDLAGLSEPLIAILEERNLPKKGKIISWLGRTHDSKAIFIIAKYIETKPPMDEWDDIIYALHEIAKNKDEVAAERAVLEMEKYFLSVDPKEMVLTRQNLVRMFCEKARQTSLPALERIHKVSKDPVSKDYALETMLQLSPDKYLTKAIAQIKSEAPGYYLLRGLKKIINDSNRKLIIETLLQRMNSEPVEKNIVLFIADHGSPEEIKAIQEKIPKMSPQTRMELTWKMNGWKADVVLSDWVSPDALREISLNKVRKEFLDEWGNDFGEEQLLFHFLEKTQKLYSFDTEADEIPVRHDLLISDLCKITAGKLNPNSIKQIWHQKNPEDYDANYTLEFVFRNKLYRFPAENLGDWYDVAIIIEALNLALQTEQIPERFIMFGLEDQVAYVTFEKPERTLKLAAKYSIPISNNTEEAMEFGKEYEESVRKQIQSEAHTE